MHILFTGGSSFTGFWFVKTLADAGHTITAPLFHSLNEYKGTRKRRVELLKSYSEIIENCSFGSKDFLKVIDSKERWDLICHHAADVTNYKDSQFDYVKALKNNTNNINSVIQHLNKKGCHKILLTGSVFEQNEGKGSENLRAASPYGLSKGLTSDVFKYYADIHGFHLGKFVIPNPFGPYEEERFTSFLVKTWIENKVAKISHPSYVRDNIHISLLAKAYSAFALKLDKPYQQINPSGYIESQGNFAERFAKEMRERLNLPCQIEKLEQQDFTEPKTRYNTTILNLEDLRWEEASAWDELAQYYKTKHNLQ
ncbi:MAG: NAD(P)-dependent oxidoreductase [Chlamydiota bacterium]|nr:NAD(P)-dependent oxidoreductase [Chlamydiota bacterium]